MNSFILLWKQTDRHGTMLVQILCNVYLAAVAIFVSRLAQKSIDENLIVTEFTNVVVIFAVLGGTGIVVSGLYSQVSGRYAAYVTAELREKSLARIAHCKYAYIENEHSGTIINKLTNDVNTVSEYIAFNLPEVLRAAITFGISLIYLLTVNWVMTLACLICVPVALWMTKKFADPTYDTMEKFWEEMDEIAAMAKDTLSESKVEKSYNLLKVRGEAFDAKMNGATKLYVDFERLMAKSGAFKYILRSAPTLLCILAGFAAAYMGIVTGGTFAAFILMLRNISEPLSKVIGYVTDYKEAEVSMDRVAEILLLEDEDSDAGTVRKLNVDTVTAHVDKCDQNLNTCGNVLSAENIPCYEFKSVTFSYGEKKVLDGLQGVIQKGKMTAIVGDSGSGKSTLFKILAGFYEIDTVARNSSEGMINSSGGLVNSSSGTILMNGEDLASMNKEEMRAQIAYVEQNSFLFHQTVAENIAAGDPDAAMQQIIQAAKQAYAHDFIMALPEGYQTVLAEEGLNISGGQRQRIAIARAFMKDAPVLLMDEMTSALDEESEKLIKQALDAYRKDRTVIVVAHRLSTIIDADEILFLRNGKFTEKGTHEELMRRNGYYAQTYERRGAGDETVD